MPHRSTTSPATGSQSAQRPEDALSRSSAPRDLEVGEGAELRGDFDAAALYYSRAATDPQPSHSGEATFRSGRIAWRQGRHDEALAAYDGAREIAISNNLTELQARAENGIGAVHYARGEYARARASYGVALALTTDRLMVARINLNLGVIANIEGAFTEARDAYIKSLDAFRYARDLPGEALALQNLGMLHGDLAEWDEADEAYARCIQIAEQLGNSQLLADILLNRAEVLLARDRAGAALSSASQSLMVYTDLGDEEGRAEAMRWQGICYRVTGNREAAERALRDCIRIAARLRSNLLEAEASLELARLYVEIGQPDNAIKRYERAIVRFTELGAQRELEASVGELARLTPT